MHNNYIVFSIKYRPNDFSQVVGQKYITHTLERAIQENRLPQALLFCGPRGVGKTTCARIIARKVNNFSTEDISEKKINYLNIFELDAASNNSVDDIRNIIDQLRFPPQQGKFKVYIIDEVHMLSKAAFNAFLKTLEEPPSHVIFILATTEKQKILPTIISRCQVYDFCRITDEEICKQLKKISNTEGIQTEEEALYLIAKNADGSLRDAISLFDRLVSANGKELITCLIKEQLGIIDNEFYFKVTECCINNDIKGMLNILYNILQNGFDPKMFIVGLASHFRNLLIANYSNSGHLLETSTPKKYYVYAIKVSSFFFLETLEICRSVEMNYNESSNPRLLIEIALIKLVLITKKYNFIDT